MELLPAVSFIFALFLCFHLCITIYQKWRCRASTVLRLDEVIQIEQNNVSMHVRSDEEISSFLKAGISFRCEGRIVLTQQRLLLGSSVGRLLEVSHEHPGVVRVMGPRRLLIKGLHPSQKGRLRVELVVDDEKEWQEKLQYCSFPEVERV